MCSANAGKVARKPVDSRDFTGDQVVRTLWHPRTPLAIARQMLQPRHVCRASLPPGGEATQLQTGALEGFGGCGAPRAGAPPGLIPEAVLSCGGCMEPFPEPFQSSSWGQKAESRVGWGGLGWGSRAKTGDPRARPEWTQRRRDFMCLCPKEAAAWGTGKLKTPGFELPSAPGCWEAQNSRFLSWVHHQHPALR